VTENAWVDKIYDGDYRWVQDIGNDGLTDEERTAYAEQYARTAGNPSIPEALRELIQRRFERGD
jgi:hypothetical protein